MRIKEIKPINFVFFRTETTLQQLSSFFHVAGELFQEAVKLRMTITGPIHWHYHGFMGDATKPFTLEIALPVAETLGEYDGPFHFKRTEPFRCVVTEHEGNWMEMGQSYEKLMRFVTENQLVPTAHNREVYVNVDFRDTAANTTEIQLGIN